MATDEIQKHIALLNVDTIKEALKQASRSPANGKATKSELVKLYEAAVMDVGIEKFINRINDSLIEQTAKLLDVDNTKAAVIAKIQTLTIQGVLQKTSTSILLILFIYPINIYLSLLYYLFNSALFHLFLGSLIAVHQISNLNTKYCTPIR